MESKGLILHGYTGQVRMNTAGREQANQHQPAAKYLQHSETFCPLPTSRMRAGCGPVIADGALAALGQKHLQRVRKMSDTWGSKSLRKDSSGLPGGGALRVCQQEM